MSFVVTGRTWLPAEVDAEGHRTYKLLCKCVGTDDLGGPASALTAAGLPTPGSTWLFKGDFDNWAWCRAEKSVTPAVEDEAHNVAWVTCTFSTKPAPKDKQRCQDNPIENPLLEPPKISGDFSLKAEEATHDRHGELITNSAHEQMRGAQVEFDEQYSKVVVEVNIGTLDLALLTYVNNKVNDSPMWSLPARCWKVTIPSWERKFYGTCSVYYTVKIEVSANYRTWDRDLLDEGTKVLHGHWDRVSGAWILDNIGGSAPDRFNPQHFDRFTDRQNNPAKVILDGRGQPSGVRVSSGTFNQASIELIRLDTTQTVQDAENTARLLGGVADLCNRNRGISAAADTLANDAQRLWADYNNAVGVVRASDQAATDNAPATTLQTAANEAFAALTALTARLDTLYTDALVVDAVIAAAVDTVRNMHFAAVTFATSARDLINEFIAVPANITAGTIADEGQIHVEKYGECDILGLLGLPTVI